jgi:hypothetical protein
MKMSEVTYAAWVPEELRAFLDRALAEKRAVEATGKVIYEVAFMGPDPDYEDDEDNMVLASKRFRSLEKAIASIGSGAPEDAEGATHVTISTVYKNTYEEIECHDICEDGHLQRRVSGQ